MKILGIVNQKGGVGKTATAVAVADGLARRGYRVLAVDDDPQGQLSISFGITEVDEMMPPALKLLSLAKNGCFEYATVSSNLDVVPGGLGLESANVSLAGKIGRESLLKKALACLKDYNYDFVVIDTNPSLSLLTLNAICACTDVIVPFKPEFQSINGITLLLNTINEIKQLNPDIKLAGFLATMADRRRTSTSQVLTVVKDIADEYGCRLFNSIIRCGVAAADAPSFGVSLFEYNSRSAVSKDYELFVDELVKYFHKNKGEEQ